ncbi:RNA polymerase sigma factor [Planctomycetaceae bacterium SH139]
MAGLIPTTRASLVGGLSAARSELVWHDFFLAYRPVIQHWASKSGIRPNEADDLLSDIYLHLIERLARFTYSEDRRFRGWLRLCVASAIAEFQRKRHKQVGEPISDRRFELACESLAARELEEEFSESLGRQIDLGNQIAMAVKSRVNQKNWQAFYFTYVLGEETEEAASKLGISKGAVHIARCRVKAMLVREAAKAEQA